MTYPQMTLTQVRKAMRQACEDAGVPMPRVERGAERNCYGSYYPGQNRVVLRDMRDGPIALHEIAHHITYVRFNDNSHGATWRSICANLLVYYCGATRDWAQGHVNHYGMQF